jgi:hypothetical protein
MQAIIEVSQSSSPDDVLDVFAWLQLERGLNGQVRYVPRAPAAGTLGVGPGEVAVIVSSAGAVTALAGSLTAWLKTRRSDIAISVTTESGSVTVGATNATEGRLEPLLRQVLDAQFE